MHRALAVFRKELRDILHHPTLIGTMLVPVVVLALLPVLSFVASGQSPGELLTDPSHLPAILDGATAPEIAQYRAVSPFFLLWLMFPVSIPSALAAYSIVGEKEEGTLEPLLATPIGTGELLFAKALAAGLPGVLLVWLPYLATLLTGALTSTPRVLAATLLSPGWLLGMVLVMPLVTFLTVMLLVVASARANDVRAANQVGSLLVLPVVGLFLSRVTQGVFLEPRYVLLAALVLAGSGLLALRGAVRVFARETVLVRWKQSR